MMPPWGWKMQSQTRAGLSGPKLVSASMSRHLPFASFLMRIVVAPARPVVDEPPVLVGPAGAEAVPELGPVAVADAERVVRVEALVAHVDPVEAGDARRLELPA